MEDSSEVKLSCSLRWLSGMLTQTEYSDKEHIQQLLLVPFHEGALREDVISILTTPHLYTSVYNAIVPNEQPKETTFWPLIHSLARRGIYVTEEGDGVNHAVLTQQSPFKKKSHVALIDALISLYISSVVSVSKMVKTVKRFSTFNASQDLPSDIDGCFQLWLNKISQYICERRKNEMDILLQDPDTQQRRRNKLKLMGTAVQPLIRPVKNICSDVADGQCLAALLLYYTPDKVTWADFHFSEHALSKNQAQRNLLKVNEVCASFLPPPGFHVAPDEILTWHETSILKSNIQALLSLLYHNLDYKHHHKTNSTTSTSDIRVLQPKHNSFSTALAMKKAAPPPSILAKKRHTIHSFSANDLYAASSRALKSRGTSNNNTNNNSNSFQSLSSYSTSALTSKQEQYGVVLPPVGNPAGLGSLHSSSTTSSTVFKPPMRSSVNASQAAALASFKKPPLSKGPHSQSSPAMRIISVSDVPPPMSFKPSRQQISASTDNLFIREKMLTEKLNRAATGGSGALSVPQRYTEKSNNSSGNSSDVSIGSNSSSEGADVSGNCTTATNSLRNGQVVGVYTRVQGTSHKSDDEELQLLSHAYHSQVVSSDSSKALAHTELETDSNSPLKLGIELKHREIDTRSSFTLNKKHTYASASAAGLPIINSDKDVVDGESAPPLKESSTSVAAFNDSKTHERSSSDSSSGSSHTLLYLTIYSDRNVKVHHEKVSNVPPSVLERRRQLHSKMSERRTQQAIIDKQVLIEKQKLGQKVYLAAMEKSRESSVEPVVPNGKQAVKNNNQSKVSSKRIADSGQTRTVIPSSQQTSNNKTASLTQFEFLEAQVKAKEVAAISSTAKKPSIEPRGHPLGAIALSPIAPCKINDTTETSTEEHSQEDSAVAIKESVRHNPWGEQRQLHLKQPTLNPVSQEELRKKREQLVKTRLEEREKARKMAIEKRRKEAKEKNVQQLATTNAPLPEDKETIHFVLSNHQLPQASAPSTASTTSPARTTSEPSASRLSDYLAHNGPECYIKPQTKTNKKIIKNALCHVCLAGEVNLTVKQRALEELEASTANHVMILFRDTIGFKFRALYWYSPDTDYVTKIFGNGPRIIKQHMISHFYKYNSGLKEFKEIRSRAFSISFDAFTMKNEFWTNRKSNPPLAKRPSTGAFK